MDARARSALFRTCTAVLSTGLVLVVLEGVLRGYNLVRNRREPPVSELVDVLGWQAAPDVSASYGRKGYGRVTYSTDAWGFRRSGDPRSSKVKVLVLGDSTTQAYQVSDGRAYYDVLAAQRPDLEVFAYGVGGYATLQQVLTMERHWQRIQPDLVLWQLSFNDFIGNDFELERASRENNNHMRRPYLEEGRVIYRHPDGAMGWLTARSHLARRLKVWIDGLFKRSVGTIETELSLDHPALRRSIATTKLLMARAIAGAAGRPVVAFEAASLARCGMEEAAFAEVCNVPGLDCVTGLNDALRRAARGGTRIDGSPYDGHWNAAGHALAARAILQFLEKRGYLGDSRSLRLTRP